MLLPKLPLAPPTFFPSRKQKWRVKNSSVPSSSFAKKIKEKFSEVHYLMVHQDCSRLQGVQNSQATKKIDLALLTAGTAKY